MFDIIGKRNWFFGLSIAILLTGIAFFFVNGGFKLDIQFEGGTIIEVDMPNANFETTAVEALVKKTINKEVAALKSHDGNRNAEVLTLNISKDNTLNDEERGKLLDALAKEYNVKADTNIRLQTVEPFIGKEIMNDGLKAVVLASILIIFYIALRFRVMSGWAAGVWAVVALLHDMMIMLTVYVIFRVPLNESFIAAALTILGYSMNDTIIIYDRIRENSHQMRKQSIAELVNTSILQTLSRSINTVVTVLISVCMVYGFAKYHNIKSIQEFAFPLIVGIASGCYSSIFIASPLYVVWKEFRLKRRVSAAKS